MSAEENKAIIRRYFETLSGKVKHPEEMGEFVAEERLKEHIAFFDTVFPRYELVPERMVAEGDPVSVIGLVR